MADQMNLQMIFDLVDESSRDLQRISKNLKDLDKNMKNVNKSQTKMQKAANMTGKILKTQFDVLNTPLAKFASVGAIAGILGTSAKKALDFSDGMAEVATLTSKSAKEIEESFKPIVQNIQRSFGKDSQDVIKALYDGISAGIPATEGAVSKYLDAVARMSIGGRASMEESGDLITTIMNVWAKTGITAEEASNSIFGAVKMGKTTVGQLAQSFGQIANDARVAGASIEETTASIAALTSIGIKTPETMTKLRGLMKSLVSPAEGAAKAFNSLGIKSIGGMMQSFKDNKFLNTLQEIDKRLRKTTRTQDEYNQAVAKLFPDREAASAFTALMTTANDKFNESLKETVRTGGQAATAMKKMETAANDVRKANQELNIALQNMGEVMTPYIAESAKWFSSIFTNLKLIVDNAAHIENLRKEDLNKTDKALGAGVQGYSPEKVGSGIQTILAGLRATRGGKGKISPEELAARTKSYQININVDSKQIEGKENAMNLAKAIQKPLEKQIEQIEREKQRRKLTPEPKATARF